MPADLARRVELLMVHSVGCTAAFSQAAAIAALDGPVSDITAMRDEYRVRRDLVVRELNAIDGVKCRAPDGAFYAWADVSSFGLSSRDIAQRLLQDGFVAVLPGTDFGDGGEGFIRISYGTHEGVLGCIQSLPCFVFVPFVSSLYSSDFCVTPFTVLCYP
jgi:aspartate aminotransferase